MYLKELRERKKITQEEIAQKLNIHCSRVSKWETNKAEIPKKHIEELLKILNCTIYELENGDLVTNIEQAIEAAKITIKNVDANTINKFKKELLANLNNINEINLKLLQLSTIANIEYKFYYKLLYKEVNEEEKKKIILSFINALNQNKIIHIDEIGTIQHTKLIPKINFIDEI